MTVHSKLMDVMKGLNKIEPSKMEFGRTKYAYLSENAMTPAIKELFEEHGLVIKPVSVNHQIQPIMGKNNRGEDEVDILATVVITYNIVEVETGDTIQAVGIGSGMDKGDKSIPKACTAALKQMFRHLLLIASPDRLDPDSTASESLRPPRTAPASAPAKSTAPATPATQQVAGDVVKFGKYSGKTLEEILAVDKKYVEWLAGKAGEFQEAAKALLD